MYSNVIDLDEESDEDIAEISEKKALEAETYDFIFKESPLLGEVLEKCLELDNSDGIKRVICRSIVPIFKKIPKDYLKTPAYGTVITRTLCKLEKFPHLKFTHLKELCESLRFNSKLKSQNIAYNVLKTNNGWKLAGHRKRKVPKEKSERFKRMKNVSQIILSDDSDGYDVPIVETMDVGLNFVTVPVEFTGEFESHQNIANKNVRLNTAFDTDKISDDSQLESETLRINGENDSRNTDSNDKNQILEKVNDTNKKKYIDSDVIEIVQTDDEKDTGNVIARNYITENTSDTDDITILDSEPIEIVQIDDEEDREKDLSVGNEKLRNTYNTKDATVLDSEPNDHDISTDDGKKNTAVNADSVKKNLKSNENVITVNLSDDEIVDVVNINSDSVYNTLCDDLDKLLVPRKEEIYPGYDEILIMDRIKNIEKEIAHYKSCVAILEEAEVTDDTNDSPYIQCEQYKAKIVALYRELCKLTGEKAVKRREVRLKATNEKSQLPMQILEKFINDNIGKDGLPHFPDFNDVVQCVVDANTDGDLGWSRATIMKEARALFTQCGQALQKSRQRREWRDMLSLVKRKMIEDPADSDPELMARLQANKQQATTKESELLERYSEMNHESGSETDDCDTEKRYLRSEPKNNTTNRTRITPTSIPFVSVHKVTRIVSRGNEVVEVGVLNKPSDEYNEPEHSNLQISVRNMHIIITPPKANKASDIEANNTVIDERNTGIRHSVDETSQSDVKTIDRKAEINKVTSSNDKMQDTNTSNTISNEVNDITNSGGNIQGITQQQQQKINICESISNVFNKKSSVIKFESDQIDNEVTNISQTNNACKPISENEDKTHDFLAHFLKARVVLSRFSIKYESEPSSKVPNPTVPDIKSCNNENIEKDVTESELKVRIKDEQGIDIQEELNALGDNFTTTIIDIIDPFLVVEISSDSSSEDESEEVSKDNNL